MLYAITAVDAPDTFAKRLSARAAHVERLLELKEQGRLVLAGPLQSADNREAAACGSLIVAEFDSQEDAQNWIDKDPYFAAGVYAKAEAKPFIKLLP